MSQVKGNESKKGALRKSLIVIFFLIRGDWELERGEGRKLNYRIRFTLFLR